MNNLLNSDEEEYFTLLVGNIPPSFNEEILQNFFCHYGNLAKIILWPFQSENRGVRIALVTFKEVEVANKLIEIGELILEGKKISLRKATEEDREKIKSQRDQKLKLYARGFEANTTEAEIRTLFENYGPVSQILMPHKNNGKIFRGFAYIIMQDEEGFNRALETKKVKFKGLKIKMKSAILGPELVEKKKKREKTRE